MDHIVDHNTMQIMRDLKRKETLEMLHILRDNASGIVGDNTTIISDVELTSFQFVMDNAIELIKAASIV